VTWSSRSGWSNDGSIAVQSQSVWYTFANWNASGLFNYGDNKYYITATENDFVQGSGSGSSSDDDSMSTVPPTSRPTSFPTFSGQGLFSTNDDEFYLLAYGAYGAKNILNW
jgi:hypothetical protein